MYAFDIGTYAFDIGTYAFDIGRYVFDKGMILKQTLSSSAILLGMF